MTGSSRFNLSWRAGEAGPMQGAETFPSAHPVLAGLVSLLGKWTALACLGVIGWLSLRYLTQRYDVEPYLPLLVLLAVAGVMVALRKARGALVAALLYVGNFKTTPAVGISLTDPTFIVLALCAAGLFLECLFIFSDREHGSIAGLFTGQGRAVSLFALFLLMIAVSALYTTAPESGLLKLERIAVFGTLSFVAPFILFKRPEDLNQFLFTFVVLGVALALRTLLALIHPEAAVLSGDKDITHIGDGELMATAAVILIYRRFPHMSNFLRFACIASLTIGFIASAARSVGLSLFLVLALTPLFVPRGSAPARSRGILLGVVLAVIVAAGALSLISHLPEAEQMKLAHKAGELRQLLQGSFLPGGTAEQRMTFYEQSLMAIRERPIIGWGVGGWGVFFLGTDEKAIPHNFVLEAAVEQGLVGCGLLLAILLTTWAALRSVVRRAGSYFVFLLPVFLLTVQMNLITGDLESRLIWFWCGTILAVSRMLQLQFRPPRFVDERESADRTC